MTAAFDEEAVVFKCEGEFLVGVLSAPHDAASRGVLILVGGPQYRAGSHRQFALLARDLAQANVASLRFDYRGMGDSGGQPRTFESVASDIRSAIDVLVARVPTLKEVVVWGLCDAASAALLYAADDARVTGLVLLNPWVRTEQGAARVYLRHYYLRRLFQSSLWRKLVMGEFRFREAARAFSGLAVRALRGKAAGPTPRLPDRMEAALRTFRGRVLVILSGRDLTADEFRNLVSASPGWRRLLESPRVTRHELPDANHTFSRRDWRDQVAHWTAAWVRQGERS